MGLRGLAVALALVSACSVGRPTGSPAPTATREPEALNVTVLLDLSGPLRGPSGAPQRDALQLWADQHSSGSPLLRTRIVAHAGGESQRCRRQLAYGLPRGVALRCERHVPLLLLPMRCGGRR